MENPDVKQMADTNDRQPSSTHAGLARGGGRRGHRQGGRGRGEPSPHPFIKAVVTPPCSFVWRIMGEVYRVGCTIMEAACTARGARHRVRKTPSWPISWANFSFSWLYSHRNAWANLHILSQPNTLLATGRGRRRRRDRARGGRAVREKGLALSWPTQCAGGGGSPLPGQNIARPFSPLVTTRKSLQHYS
jgi:hypothetical protein